MGLRLRWRFRVAPGVHLNVSKSGLSVSLGGAPATLNIGREGLKGTISAPGTGIAYSKDLPFAPQSQQTQPPLVEMEAAPRLNSPDREGPGILSALIGLGLILLLGLGVWRALAPAPLSEPPSTDSVAVAAPAPSPIPIDVPLPRPRPITR